MTDEIAWPVYTWVRVVGSAKQDTLFIPLSTFWCDDMGMAQVWIVNDKNQLESRDVTPGRVLGDRVEILTGLEHGDRYVSKATSNIKEGQSVDAPLLPLAEPDKNVSDDMGGMEGMDHGH